MGDNFSRENLDRKEKCRKERNERYYEKKQLNKEKKKSKLNEVEMGTMILLEKIWNGKNN